MAAYMTISLRFSSWRDYHLSKKKETEGFTKKSSEKDGFLATGPWPTFVGDQYGFMRAVDWFEGEAFLLLPAGGNRVNLIHNCFKADVKDGSGLSVFGIFGSRVTSPIKRLNMGQAVKHQIPQGHQVEWKRREMDSFCRKVVGMQERRRVQTFCCQTRRERLLGG